MSQYKLHDSYVSHCIIFFYSNFFFHFDYVGSVARVTLTGVTQLKIGDVCLFIYLYNICDSLWEKGALHSNQKKSSFLCY